MFVKHLDSPVCTCTICMFTKSLKKRMCFSFVLHFSNKKLNEVVFVGETRNVCICLPAGVAVSSGPSEGKACRLSKLPPVNPVCELLTLSTVRLAVAIIRTWPGLRGAWLGVEPCSAQSLRRPREPRLHWRALIPPCTTQHPPSIMPTMEHKQPYFYRSFKFFGLVCLVSVTMSSNFCPDSFII